MKSPLFPVGMVICQKLLVGASGFKSREAPELFGLFGFEDKEAPDPFGLFGFELACDGFELALIVMGSRRMSFMAVMLKLFPAEMMDGVFERRRTLLQ